MARRQTWDHLSTPYVGAEAELPSAYSCPHYRGGGITPSRKFVEGPHKGFLVPEAVLAAVFRSKFLKGVKSLWKKGNLLFPGRLSQLRNPYEWKEYLDSLYQKHWLSFLKETFNGNGNAVEYIARYAYRTAISNSRMDHVDTQGVTFHYKDYADGGKQKLLSMPGGDFIHAFLRHILPSGFHRVRFSGFLSNCVKTKSLTLIHKRFNRIYMGDPLRGINMRELLIRLFHKDICECPNCKAAMIRYARGIPILAVN